MQAPQAKYVRFVKSLFQFNIDKIIKRWPDSKEGVEDTPDALAVDMSKAIISPNMNIQKTKDTIRLLLN